MSSEAAWKQDLCNCCGDCEACELNMPLALALSIKRYYGAVLFSGLCGTFCGYCQIYQNAENLGKSGESKIDLIFDLYLLKHRRAVLPAGLSVSLHPHHAAQAGGEGEIQHRGENGIFIQNKSRKDGPKDMIVNVSYISIMFTLFQGSTGGDAMASFCCGACVSCQTSVEIKERGDKN